MREVVIVPCYKRWEILACTLKRIRQIDLCLRVILFPDRGTWKDLRIHELAKHFDAELIRVPEHSYHGNSYNSGEALRFAYNSGFDLIHYVEDDALPKPDLFSWTRQIHDLHENIFCSAGWVFNLHSPIDSGDYFAPWLYIPQFSIKRDKLELAIEHLGPSYYSDMHKYLVTHFEDSLLNKRYPNVVHYELDGLLQRVLTVNRLQVAWPSIAKVTHVGLAGYNRGGYERYEDFFKGIPEQDFAARVEAIEKFIADPYFRASAFSREVVEREIGREIPKREFTYRIKFDGWETTYTSELSAGFLPSKIYSVPIPADAEIVVSS